MSHTSIASCDNIWATNNCFADPVIDNMAEIYRCLTSVQARCKGVSWLSSTQLTNAPFSSNVATISMEPLKSNIS